MASERTDHRLRDLEAVAGNGLINRRALLGRGALFAGAIGTGVGTSLTGAAAEPLAVDSWSLGPGNVIPAYGVPAKYEDKVVRTLTNPAGNPGGQNARTPHHLLNGTITPNGLHFVIARAGFPDIDPAKHRLAIHGLVKQPLVFTLDALARYPMVSRITFVECGGNSGPLFRKEPVQANVQAIHGARRAELCGYAASPGRRRARASFAVPSVVRMGGFLRPTLGRALPDNSVTSQIGHWDLQCRNQSGSISARRDLPASRTDTAGAAAA